MQVLQSADWRLRMRHLIYRVHDYDCGCVDLQFVVGRDCDSGYARAFGQSS